MIERNSGAIIIAGHSHTAALIGTCDDHDAGIRLLPVAGYDRIFGLHGPLTHGYPTRTEEYWSALARYGEGNAIALLFAGNEPNWAFLFQEEFPAVDFIPRQLQSLPIEEGAVIVPEALVRAEIQRLVGSSLGDVLGYLKARANSRIAIVGAPPPKGDNERLRSFIEPEYAHVKIISALVRLKFWHVLQDVYRQQAAIHDVEFIPPPDAMMDERGFLKRELWADDLTHANRIYGKAMINHLRQKLLPGGSGDVVSASV